MLREFEIGKLFQIIKQLVIIILLFLKSRKDNVYVYNLFYDRIGHQIPLSLYFAVQKGLDGITIFTTDSIANDYWYDKTKNWLNYKGFEYFRAAVFLQRFSDRIFAIETANLDPKLLGKCNFASFKELFDSTEKDFFDNWIRSLGIDNTRPILVLNIRDNAYLNEKFMSDEVDLAYHNYRNSNIWSYEKSIKYMISEGYTVIRFGSRAELRSNIRDINFIDYPFCQIKSAKLEILIMAFADLYISTVSGPDAIAWVRGIPQLYINMLPLSNMFCFANAKCIPKKLISNKTNLEFNLLEYLKDKRYSSIDYDADNIEIQDLSEDEILDYVKEYLFEIRHEDTISVSDIEIEKILTEFASRSDLPLHVNFRLSKIWLSKVMPR